MVVYAIAPPSVLWQASVSSQASPNNVDPAWGALEELQRVIKHIRRGPKQDSGVVL